MHFQALTPDHAPAFIALFDREKGSARSHQRPPFSDWAFFQQPRATPDIPIVEVAVEEDADGRPRLLGAMGAIPQTLLDGDRAIPAAFFVDWLVDSRARRRKIGSQLIRRAAARFPVAIHMGSTPEGYATCATLGAVDCGQTATARRILHPAQWAKATGRNALARVAWAGREQIRGLGRPALHLPELITHPVTPDAIDDQLQACSRALAQSHVCTLRDAARWRWLLDSPLYSGYAVEVCRHDEVIGYAALVVGRRGGRCVGHVADVAVPHVEAAPLVIAAGLADLTRHPVDGLAFTVTAAIADQVVTRLAFDELSRPRMGAWLHPGYEPILDRPWFMTMAENLSVAAGVDWPVVQPALAASG